MILLRNPFIKKKGEIQLIFMKKRKKGYSLAEILITIALVGVGLLSVIGIFPLSIAHIRASASRVFVIQQLQAKMEALKSMSYQSLFDEGTGTSTEAPLMDLIEPNMPAVAPGGDNYTFRVYKNVSPLDPNGVPLKEKVIYIKVEIYWDDINPYSKEMTRKSCFVEGFKSAGSRYY